MNTIGFISNKNRDRDYRTAKKLIRHTMREGGKAVLCGEISSMDGVIPGVRAAGYDEPDALVVLGGDGTLLRAARNASEYETPLLGINMGKVGYLTDVPVKGASNAVSGLLAGRYKLERRMMLETSLSAQCLALNEVCVTRGSALKIVDFHIYINGEHMDSFRADGVIISTPTGSTAYSLSAGGPVIKPDAELIVITPVCPHTLHTRPVVVSSDDIVGITAKSAGGGDSAVYMDGQNTGRLARGKMLEVRRSKRYTTIIKTNPQSFYQVLREKLRWG